MRTQKGIESNKWTCRQTDREIGAEPRGQREKGQWGQREASGRTARGLPSGRQVPLYVAHTGHILSNC